MVKFYIKNQGYFTAEFNFKTDTPGDDPAGWTVVDGDGAIQVIQGIDGHKHVVEIEDVAGGANPYIRDGLSAETNGTIEYWFRSNYAGVNPIWWLDTNGNVSDMFCFGPNLNQWQYQDNTGWHNTGHAAPVANKWYHISIDFECGGGNYNPRGDGGLAADTFRIYLTEDGVETQYGDYNFIAGNDNIVNLTFYASAGAGTRKMYIDAVDYSWSSGFSINRNQSAPNTDITTDVLKWEVAHKLRDIPKCQMLINSANQAIESDDIILITGNVNDFYKSKIVPAGVIYKESLDFRNETLGAFPINADHGTWADQSGANCDILMIDKYNDHAHVICMRDKGGLFGERAQMTFTLTAGVEAGSIEFWIATDDATKEIEFYLFDETPNATAGVRIDADKFYYWDQFSTWIDFNDSTPQDGKWYRVIITFDCSDESLSYLIVDEDGNTRASQGGLVMDTNPTTVNSFRFFTQNSDANYYIYVGSIGLTWDADYTLGDNADLDTILAGETIFEGMIEKKDKKKIQKLWLRSLSDEAKNVMPGDEGAAYQPDGYGPVANYTEEVIAEIINDKCSIVTAALTDEVYRGNYTFENDPDNSVPFGFYDASGGANTFLTKTDAAVANHLNLLELVDNDANRARGYLIMEKQPSGTIEFWVYTTDATLESIFYLMSSAGQSITGFMIDADNFYFTEDLGGGAVWTDMATAGHPLDNTWYRVKIDFDCSTDVASIYIYGTDGVEIDKAEGYTFGNVSTYFRYLDIYTGAADNGYTVYYDAIGFSWSNHYSISDNKHIYIEKVEVGASTLDLSLDGSKTIKKLQDVGSDNEVFTWVFDSDHALIYTEGDIDSQLDFSSSQVWAVSGIDKVKRVNKVWLKGGYDGVPARIYSSADNLDSQGVYGIKLVVKFYTLITVQSELDIIAANVLTYDENIAKTVGLFYSNPDIDFIQPGQTVTISSNDIRYSGNDDIYVDSGQWLITYVKVEGMGASVKWLDIDIKDALEFEYDIEDAQELEFLINQ